MAMSVFTEPAKFCNIFNFCKYANKIHVTFSPYLRYTAMHKFSKKSSVSYINSAIAIDFYKTSDTISITASLVVFSVSIRNIGDGRKWELNHSY